MPDHVHMCVSIPPKHGVANAVGKLKGKSAILVNQKFGRRKKVMGFRFWSRGYCASAVGLDEQVIRSYIRTQEQREIAEPQLLTMAVAGTCPLIGGILKLPALRVVPDASSNT